MHKIITFLLLIVSVFLFSCGNQQPQSAYEVLVANLEATGGQDNWKTVETVEIKQQETVSFNDNVVSDKEQDLKIRFPYQQRVDSYANGQLVNVSLNPSEDESFLFRFENGKATGFSSLEATAPCIKKELELMNKEHLAFSDSMNNEKTFYILRDSLENKEYIYNATTLLLEAQVEQTPYGESTKRFSDYKEFEGLKLALKEETRVPASTYENIKLIKSVQFNAPLSDDDFEQDKSWLTIQKGAKLPEFKLMTYGSGSEVSPGSLNGKIVLLDFWATWCKPCIKEFPNIREAYENYHDQGFEVIGISVDENEAAFQKFLEKYDFPWENIYHGEGFDSDFAKTFQLASIPRPILINEEGVILATDNEASGEALNEILVTLFDS